MNFFTPPPTKPLPPPPPIKPPPQNLEEIARQRKLIKNKRTNRQDFIIDPVNQGLSIPTNTNAGNNLP